MVDGKEFTTIVYPDRINSQSRDDTHHKRKLIPNILNEVMIRVSNLVDNICIFWR